MPSIGCRVLQIPVTRAGGRDHNVETPVQEQQGQMQFIRQVVRLRILGKHRRLAGAVPAPDSKAAEDRRVSSFHSIYDSVQHSLSVAADHLETVATFYAKTGHGMPPFAMYTLIRSAIEAAAYGLWLLEPASREERILRSLRYTYGQLISGEKLRQLVGQADEEKHHRLLRKLEGVRNDLAGNNGPSIKRGPTTSQVIEAADRLVQAQTSGLIAWKACSGIAHAEQIASLHLLERRWVQRFDDGTSQYVITTSATILADFMTTAVDFLERLDLMDRQYRASAS